MTEKTQVAGLPTSSKVLSSVYALIAISALIATWSQNLAYAHAPNFISAFATDTKVTAASRSITVDLFLFMLPVAILMVTEARKHGIKFVWAYILGAAFTAISITFPLFLIARELRIANTSPTRLGTADAICLGIFAAGIAAIVIWVDLV
ncbi:MAG: DUF2834 domain-containing protein [Mycobacterium sp.]